MKIRIGHEEVFLALRQCPCRLAILARDATIAWTSSLAYGFGEAEILGSQADACLHPDDRPMWRAAFYRARDRRECASVQVRLVTPEPPGEAIHQIRLFPLHEPGASEVRLVAALAEDVTHEQPAVPFIALPPRPLLVPPGAKWLSPLGERVMYCLASRWPAWTTGEAIADAISESFGHRLKASLTGLADRELVEASPGSGYRCRGLAGPT